MYYTRQQKRMRGFSAVLMLLVSLSIFIIAQSFTESLSGAVKDQAGALLKGATVTLTAIATSRTRTTTTNDAGEYSFPNLPPGEYRIRITADGFTTQEITAQLSAHRRYAPMRN